MSNVMSVDNSNFEQEVMKSDLPVLVDFYATWCAPCKMLAPIVDKVAAETQGKLKVVKLDTDQAPQVGVQFRIQAIPTLVLVKNGQEVARHQGVLDYGRLTGLVGPHLNG